MFDCLALVVVVVQTVVVFGAAGGLGRGQEFTYLDSQYFGEFVWLLNMFYIFVCVFVNLNTNVFLLNIMAY